MKVKALSSEETARNLWALVLAGGEGGDSQFPAAADAGANRPPSTALGAGSLLRRALDCAKLLVPGERTVLVASRRRDVQLAPEFPAPARHVPRLVLRTRHGGTALDVLLAAHWIKRQDADATVVVLPSEHPVSEPGTRMRHVAALARFVDRHPRQIVLVGSATNEAGPSRGWIETAESVSEPGKTPVWRVRRLRDAAPDGGRAAGASRWLRSTGITVSRAEALVEAGRLYSLELHVRMETATALVGTRYERSCLEECEAVARNASFEDVCRSAHGLLAASRVPRAVSPERKGRPAGPRGRFDGLVEQRTFEDNVEACLRAIHAPGSTSALWRPWQAPRRLEI